MSLAAVGGVVVLGLVVALLVVGLVLWLGQPDGPRRPNGDDS